MKTVTVKTPTLNLAYEEGGPKGGERLILLHGWPDSPRTWEAVLPHLHDAGYQTVVPYLRGYGKTTFRRRLLSKSPRHTGQPVAFAQDVIDLADRLGLARFHFIGHDWGARTAHALSAVFPKRLKSMVTISVPFEPLPAKPPRLPQAKSFWYQWLLCTKPGEELFRKDPVAYGRAQWDAWSPKGWYSESEFDAASKSWHGTTFEDVVLHSYRSRWGHAPLDPAYSALQSRFASAEKLATPTLLLHGAEDSCELPETTEGAEKHFSGPYRRIFCEGSGHFPQREKPDFTAGAILAHLERHG